MPGLLPALSLGISAPIDDELHPEHGPAPGDKDTAFTEMVSNVRENSSYKCNA